MGFAHYTEDIADRNYPADLINDFGVQSTSNYKYYYINSYDYSLPNSGNTAEAGRKSWLGFAASTNIQFEAQSGITIERRQKDEGVIGGTPLLPSPWGNPGGLSSTAPYPPLYLKIRYGKSVVVRLPTDNFISFEEFNVEYARRNEILDEQRDSAILPAIDWNEEE